MPGLDQRFRHYPQLFSRLGFAHNYQPLSTEKLDDVVEAAASILAIGRGTTA